MSFSKANSLRWARAPGVATGYLAWAIPSRPGADQTVAHCYRTKVKVEQAICGANFVGGMHFPPVEANMCPVCKTKSEAQEQALARTPRKQRDDAIKIVKS